jgi:hypothetical protein
MENENGNGQPKETKEEPKQNGQGSKPWEKHDPYRYPGGGQQYYYPYYYPQRPHSGWGWGWYYTPYTAQKAKPPKKKRSSKPAVAGALLIVAGLLSIIVGGLIGTMFLNGGPFEGMEDWDKGSSDGYGQVAGQVIYQNLTPVENAKISVVGTNQVGYSNATGHYRILYVPDGWHDLKVEKTGYVTIVQSVDVTEGYGWTGIPDLDDSTNVDFQLQPGAGEMRIGEPHGDTDDDTHRDWDGDSGMGFLRSIGTFCLATTIIFGAITVIGGFLALQRRHFPFVVLSAFFGIMAIGAGIGAILSVVALFILLLSGDEFDRKKKRRGRKKRKKQRQGKPGQPYGPPRTDHYGYSGGQQQRYNGPYYQQYPYQQQPQATLYHPRWIPPGPGRY